MINIRIDMQTDKGDYEADVFVLKNGEPILDPDLAISYKVEAAISLLRDIESDFGMLETELQDDNNRVICGALRQRMQSLTDDLEGQLTEHIMSANSVLETFGYMWTKDHKETLFLPAFRADVIGSAEGDPISEEYIAAALAKLKAANQIFEKLDGETK